LALNTGELHGSVYVNTFIMGAVEIPAYVLCIFLMNWKLMGRRWSGVFGLTGAGILSFICIPLIIFSQSTFSLDGIFVEYKIYTLPCVK